MSSLVAQNGEEESFIILGSSSPGASLLTCEGVPPSGVNADVLLKELSAEAGLAFKAHFHLADNPSPNSMLVASSIVTNDRTTLELQKKFGELLDENIILKDTLKQNNESMKEQFLLIASCQEDMMKTHKIHKVKFDETRELIEKLRSENRKFKQELKHLSNSPKSSLEMAQPTCQPASLNGESKTNGEEKVTSSVYEFVASPDEDTLHKLTSQLELVERQRRQVIVENEKLTWQKESLEHIVDVTTKERDNLKEKLNGIELEYSKNENGHLNEIRSLKATAKDLQTKLQQSESFGSVGTEEVMKRDNAIHILETKLSSLQGELKCAQLKIFELENIKLEFSRQKHANSETVRMYKEQLLELQNRLKEAQTTVFQPVRFSISSETDVQNSEYSRFIASVKVYDKTLKHLSELLNSITLGASEGFARTLQLAVSLNELKMEECSPEQIRSAIVDIKNYLDKQHSAALNTTGQVRGLLSIFEGIFQDYKEVLKSLLSANKDSASQAPNPTIDALTAALMSRDDELSATKEELTRMRANVATLQKESDERDLLRAQLDVYKGDFEAERQSRATLASDKESILQDLRGMQRRNQELVEQLEEVRKLNPNIFHSAMSRRSGASAPRAPAASAPASRAPANSTGNMARAKKKKLLPDAPGAEAAATTEGAATKRLQGNISPPLTRRLCPVCDKDFRSLKLLEQHVEHCLL